MMNFRKLFFFGWRVAVIAVKNIKDIVKVKGTPLRRILLIHFRDLYNAMAVMDIEGGGRHIRSRWQCR